VDIVVILELSQGQKVILVVLLFIDKDLEVLVQLLVDMFYLFVYLWMLDYRGN